MERIIVVANIYKGAIFEGYRIVNIDTLQVLDVSVESFKKVISGNSLEFINAEIRSDGSVHGKGMHLDRLARINSASKPTLPTYCRDKSPMVYVEYTSRGNHKAFDWGGKLFDIDPDRLVYFRSRFINMKPIYDNFTVKDVVKKQSQTPARGKFNTSSGLSIDGVKANTNQQNIDINVIEDDFRGTVRRSACMGEFVLLNGGEAEYTESGRVYTGASGIKIFDFKSSNELNDYKDVGEMTVGSKVALSALALSDINYFYFCLLTDLNRVIVPKENRFVDTACVSADTLYLNAGFVDSMDCSELLFILLHEMMHVFFRHIYTGLNKEHNLHNIATDLIINKQIAEEYGAYPNKGKIELTGRGSYASKCGIQFPTLGGLWHDDVDVQNDTSEGIYNELLEEYLKQKKNQSMSNSSSNQNSSNSSNSSNSQNGQNGSSNQSGQSSSGNQSGQSGSGSRCGQDGLGNQNGQNGSNGLSDSNDSENQQGDESTNQNQSGSGEGSGKNGQNSSKNGETGGYGESSNGLNNENTKSTEVTFRGKQIKLTSSDMVLSASDTQAGKEGIGESTLNRINKAVSTTKLAGRDISGDIEAKIKIVNVSVVKWQKLLKDYLSKLGETYYTYSSVNRKYIHSGKLMPGPRTSEENSKKLSKIVLAIDTSGSMFSDENLSYLLSVATGIVKKYKADGEIIYWDTGVTATGTFKDQKSLVKTKVLGGGGTDINCVFEYLDNKYPKRYDTPSLVLVMTDGYFGALDAKYVSKYKNVIWAITKEDYVSFTAPKNGKKAIIDLERK